MAAPVDIVNLALTLLGEQRILALNSNVKAARSASAIYDLERQNELRTHTWNFATKRMLLPASTTLPAFGFAFAYPLPVDCLRVIQVGDYYPGARRVLGTVAESQQDYQIEANQVLTNWNCAYNPVYVPPGNPTPSTPGPLKLRYTYDVVDTTQFDPSFVNAFGCRLAMKLCEDLTQDLSKRKSAAQEYQEAIATALRANAIEQPPDALPDNSWVLSRLPG